MSGSLGNIRKILVLPSTSNKNNDLNKVIKGTFGTLKRLYCQIKQNLYLEVFNDKVQDKQFLKFLENFLDYKAFYFEGVVRLFIRFISFDAV